MKPLVQRKNKKKPKLKNFNSMTTLLAVKLMKSVLNMVMILRPGVLIRILLIVLPTKFVVIYMRWILIIFWIRKTMWNN